MEKAISIFKVYLKTLVSSLSYVLRQEKATGLCLYSNFNYTICKVFNAKYFM
jgi:hypothetical protein